MLTDPRTFHAAIRRFFEGPLWVFLILGVALFNLILGNVYTALGNVTAYAISYLLFARLRRTERAIVRERARLGLPPRTFQ